METRQFDVAIVGAGPGGLAAAVTLGELGVSTLVVERRSSPSPLPRANAASTGTMELLRRWGLERRVRERSLDVEFRAWATPSLTAGTGEAVDVGFPSREQAMLVSPTAPAAIGQDDLEPLLEARAGSFASVQIERGGELLGLDADDGGYTLTVCDPSAGTKPVRARYVIGADGMHSAVRGLLGIATTGSDDLATRVAVHFRAPLWELLSERRHVIYFLTGDFADRAFIPVGRPDRWVFAMNPDHAAADERGFARQVAEAAGAPDLEIAIDRVMPVTYGTSLAERFREGRAFLIGDAAHRVTPRGATGLNTAIRDGFDIGWKLAWVLRGWAGPALLDSYERERRPVAEFNTRRSSLAHGSVLGNGLGLSADIGGRIPHLWVARGERPTSTLDLLGPGLTLFAGPEWAGQAEADGADAPPVTVERLDPITARGLGLTTDGWLLARPDGHPIGLSNPAGGVDHPWSPIGATARERGHRASSSWDRTSRRVTANASGSP